MNRANGNREGDGGVGNRVKRTWEGDWRARVRSRIRSVGCETVAEFLAKFPAEPYLRSCERLGDDVAAVQLETVQLEEAQRSGELREAAMDSLVRDLNYYLPSGWPEVAKGNFELASAYADWFVRLKQANQELETVADAVRNSLTDLCPPAGWKPSSPSDPFIKAAFARGWPLDR